MAEQRTWTVLDLINRTTVYFKEKSIDNPRLNTERLLGHVLNMSRVQLYLAFERPVNQEELDYFRELVRRRAKKEPLQYLVGQTEFMNYPFNVSPEVLIPRPETEVMVEEVIKTIKEQEMESGQILDIGTGSGCIAISLKKVFPDLRVLATDISEKALKSAQNNAHLNNIEDVFADHNLPGYMDSDSGLWFLKHDIRTPWPEEAISEFDIIISNPPYISKKEFTTLPPEVRHFEPPKALTDEADGLTYYEAIMKQVVLYKKIQTHYLFMEMSGSQTDAIISLARRLKPGTLEIIKDLNQIPRVLKIKEN
jgi:release factor glutamine methyltransferase